MSTPIILLGPHRGGKSTVAKLLSSQLSLPYLHLNSVAEQYWKEIGYSEEEQRQSWSGGWEGYYRYMQPFEAHAIERALPVLEECIVELDSRQAAFDDPDLLRRVQGALEPCPHVVLLLPTPDFDESMRLIEERQQIIIDGIDLTEHFVKGPCNHELARIVVYTRGKTPEETRDEILARIDPSAPEIILIGPGGAGKSTQGRLLSERLGVPQVAVDDIRWGYYAEIGWSREEQDRIGAEEGFAGIYRYWKPFEAYAIGRALAEHHHCVIDFGAGHSVYHDAAQFAQVRQAMAPFPNVVLLLPSPDLDESVAILKAPRQFLIAGQELNPFFTTHMLKLAKQTVYTEGKSPKETSDEVAALIGEPSYSYSYSYSCSTKTE
jgi:shikimate kinase